MRIIEKGTKQDEIWQGRCKHCRALIEAVKSELHVIYERNEELSQINCLQCKNVMFLYPKKQQEVTDYEFTKY